MSDCRKIAAGNFPDLPYWRPWLDAAAPIGHTRPEKTPTAALHASLPLALPITAVAPVRRFLGPPRSLVNGILRYRTIPQINSSDVKYFSSLGACARARARAHWRFARSKQRARKH